MKQALTLSSSVELLDGVGEVTKQGLAKLSVHNIRELLLLFPRRYDDFSNSVSIADLKPGLVTIKAKVEKLFIKRAFSRKLNIVEAVLSDSTGTTKAVWFNQPYIFNSLKEGDIYFFAGKFEFKNNHLGLVNPIFEKSSKSQKTGRILPIYPENKLINSNTIAKLVIQAIDLSAKLTDDLPRVVEKDNKLINYQDAVKQIHQPKNQEMLSAAKYRITFSEIFFLTLAAAYSKDKLAQQKSFIIDYDLDLIKKFISILGFDLTADQKKATWQILQDLSKDKPMNRLLDGDVGSGKTAVAFLTCLMVANAGYQIALMVPTELLANQHYHKAKEVFQQFGIRIALLTAQQNSKIQKKVLADIAKGRVDLVIGTHSLISEKIVYKNLALVIIDEQHRFGVNQREKLKQKADQMPHLLSMSATPIPRTLAIIVYGDLDLSIIKTMPPGRKPAITKIVREDQRSGTYSEIDKQIDKGEQVYVVCPMIEPNDINGYKSVKTEYQRLSQTIFSHRKLAMIHGKMKANQKNEIMKDFVKGKIDILISTSVIEVGVDVPNATIMLIEHAQRFGLASLHQLRGRIGRSDKQAYCYLFFESDNPNAIGRLSAMEKTNDGFRLAQIDLQTRGPGDIYGEKQHGFKLTFADSINIEFINNIKRSAESFLKSVNMLKHKRVLDRLLAINTITSLD